MARSGRRLTARPAESEHPGTEINFFQKLITKTNISFYRITDGSPVQSSDEISFLFIISP
ncbi:hypothetical protein [Fictibacillus halophilus]|uniref:hypothetical protein n=1 Tax=Fictibacillus halophilus TaxID=1610490 RepID=UPI001CF9B212|nr:hypothetical protein [Fictibacillus halophilus]